MGIGNGGGFGEDGGDDGSRLDPWIVTVGKIRRINR